MDTSVGNNVILSFVFIITLQSSPLRILAASNNFTSPSDVDCACPNEHLIFYCNAVGSAAGTTIWRVAAFDCTQNDIILRHVEYTDVGGTSGVCNNGAINGRSIGVESNCYLSQLNVTVVPELHDRPVTCHQNLNGEMNVIGNVSITVASTLYLDAPSGVKLTDVNVNQLTFTWNTLNLNCLPRNYTIAFNCGTCQATPGTATCSINQQLPITCDFSIQNMVCGQLGSASSPISVMLRVPNKPDVTLLPVYSADTKKLIRFNAFVAQEASLNIADGVSGSITSYNFSLSNTTILRNSSCEESREDNRCTYIIDVAPSLCALSDSIDVTLSASNILGHGQTSDSINIGCVNRLVQVKYDSATSAIICQFLTMTNTSKSCTVIYGQCNQMLDHTSMEISSSLNIITLNVDPNRIECYVVVAKSDEGTVAVEGQRPMNAGNGDTTTIVAVVVSVFVLIVFVVVVLVIVIVIIKVKGSKKDRSESDDITTMNMEPTPTEDGADEHDEVAHNKKTVS